MSAWCKESHARAGIVSNQPPGTWDRTRNHASVTVCDSPACTAKARRYVAASTNETAVYYPDEVSS